MLKNNRRGAASTAIMIAVIISFLLCLLVEGFMPVARRSRTAKIQEDNTVDISISWWGNDPRHEYTLDGLDLFMQKNPDIHVSHTFGVWNGYEKRMNIMMLSSRQSDVMQVNYGWLDTYSPDGSGFYDLSTLSDVIDFSNFTDADLETGRRNGVLNALPIAYNTPVILLNKTIYDRYGLDLPQSWDDYFKAAEVMSKDGIYPISMVKKQAWMLLLAWYEQKTGVSVFSEDNKVQIDEEGVKEMLVFYKSLIDAKVMPPLDDSGSQFNSGESAGTMCWISDSQRYTGSDGDEIMIGDIPMMDGAKSTGWYMKPATMWAISDHCMHPKEAGKLLNFLLNDPDFALLAGTEKGIPVSKAAKEALEQAGKTDTIAAKANAKMFADISKLKQVVPGVEKSAYIDGFKDASDLYIYDRADLDECAQQVMDILNGN
ncbi:MAG: extracellular solute-binding protein [Bulleidia sp.]|nr:extracellular solute-binding protein [Bulleidia sp.]